MRQVIQTCKLTRTILHTILRRVVYYLNGNGEELLPFDLFDLLLHSKLKSLIKLITNDIAVLRFALYFRKYHIIIKWDDYE